MQKTSKWLKIASLFILMLYSFLLIPDRAAPKITPPLGLPFAWNNDALWKQLENDFENARKMDTLKLDSTIQRHMVNGQLLYQAISTTNINITDTLIHQLLLNYFRMAPLIAARPLQRQVFLEHYNTVRSCIKQKSVNWSVTDSAVRNGLYRVLYGMRMATEEVLLQTQDKPFEPVLSVQNEPSNTPAAVLFGVQVHSGDLLLSRGGAEVSALIARGNNFPGNFSHVAMLYVDEKSNQPYLIEAHIERGVAVSSASEYIQDKKLRFMVLRPRKQSALLLKDSMLPHRAAGLVYAEALSRHIAYDFAMDYEDSTAMFCSEVGSYAYRRNGVQLWQGLSVISSTGIMNWLSDFGVKHFVTQMPADLEYDPQLSVVAEWRNPETLLKDHIDNAVMDALLVQADQGLKIEYSIWKLPFVRMIKGWCMLKNCFGKTGIIPEGMSAAGALKNQAFTTLYDKIKKTTLKQVDTFAQKNGYYPPYWKLVSMAKKAASEK